MPDDSIEVAVIVQAHRPAKTQFRASDFCAKARDAFRLLAVMECDGARLWTFDDLAAATGLPRDYCRRIIYAGIQVEYFYEVPGGFTIAPSIRRRNRKYINSLDELERAARRQIIVASGEDEHGTY